MKLNRERLIAVNHWYDGLPDEWRSRVVVWPLIFLGVLNMMLTVGFRFPFGLLVVLGILAAVVIRVPYVLGFLGPRAEVPADRGNTPPFVIRRNSWIDRVNRRFEAVPERFRFWIILAILLLAGGINMLLTFHHLFPFGLLFLLAVLGLCAIRGPYVAGWVRD